MRVVLLGLPGLYLVTVPGLFLAHALYEPPAEPDPGQLAVWGLFFSVGAGLTLVGFGSWRQPLYLVCYLPLPFVFSATLHLGASLWIKVTLATLLVWPIASHVSVRRYYKPRE